MIHIFKRGINHHTLLLLHSEGNDENELMYVAKAIDPFANVLAVRGSINEHGSFRFFKRLAIGHYDEQSLKHETHNLKSFINESARAFDFDVNKVTVIGNASGSNIAINMIMHYEKTFHKAILFHPMIPTRLDEMIDLKHAKIFISSGENDYLTPEHEVIELVQILQGSNADVELYLSKFGHHLSKDEIDAAKRWYEEET